eukprot:7254550-Prymnesium_polylepis.1
MAGDTGDKSGSPPPKAVKPYDVAQGSMAIVPALVNEYVRTHMQSKACMASFRQHLCDNRNIANFSQ